MPLAMTFFLKTMGDLLLEGRHRNIYQGLMEEVLPASILNEEALALSPLPFTFSPPMPVDGSRDWKHKVPGAAVAARSLKKGERFRIRMTWLRDAQLKALLSWAPGLQANPCRLGLDGGPVLVEGALALPTPTDRWNQGIPYQQLAAQASNSLRTITLRFCSPTLLTRTGMPYPLPDPFILFQGYLDSWETYSTVPLAPGLRTAIQKSLLVADFRIRKQLFPGEGKGVTCFAGSATFRILGRQPETVLRGLNVLADYSFFCGSGKGTDAGMGLTKRIMGAPGRQRRSEYPVDHCLEGDDDES